MEQINFNLQLVLWGLSDPNTPKIVPILLGIKLISRLSLKVLDGDIKNAIKLAGAIK